MKDLTNKELLEIILEQGKSNAKEQLDFACKVSIFMNDQLSFNTEIKSYLENNTKTNQRGLVEQVKFNSNDIAKIHTDKKVERRTVFVLVSVLTIALDFLKGLLFK
jgi:hypothetical protein|tara:strand:+ start:6271 stop:6588 length:318 start_codon:yes stop_codon:yes gene_type:complete